MNTTYDKHSPFKLFSIQSKIHPLPLVKLSKYFLPEDKGLNLTKGERIPIYDLFGNKHNVHARLVFDWIDKKHLDNLNSKDF